MISDILILLHLYISEKCQFRRNWFLGTGPLFAFLFPQCSRSTFLHWSLKPTQYFIIFFKRKKKTESKTKQSKTKKFNETSAGESFSLCLLFEGLLVYFLESLRLQQSSSPLLMVNVFFQQFSICDVSASVFCTIRNALWSPVWLS